MGFCWLLWWFYAGEFILLILLMGFMVSWWDLYWMYMMLFFFNGEFMIWFLGFDNFCWWVLSSGFMVVFITVNCWSGLFRWIYDGLAIGFRFVDGIYEFCSCQRYDALAMDWWFTHYFLLEVSYWKLLTKENRFSTCFRSWSPVQRNFTINTPDDSNCRGLVN